MQTFQKAMLGFLILSVNFSIAHAQKTCGLKITLKNYDASPKGDADANAVLQAIDINARNDFHTCDPDELPPTVVYLNNAINALSSKGIATDDPQVQSLRRMRAAVTKAIKASRHLPE